MDALRFGRQFRALRIRSKRRRSDLADATGLSRSLFSAIELGRIEGIAVGTLARAARTLDADLDVRLRWRGEQLDRLVDEAHAAVVDAVVARLRRLGWIVEVEVSFSIWGERGSIDVLAFHAGSGILLVIEAKSVIADSEATLHGLDRKARLGGRIAADRGWKVTDVARPLVVGDSATSRRRVARLATTYDTALPDRGVKVRRWLPAPTGPLSGLLFLAYDSHGGTRRRLVGRERVRRSKRAQTTAMMAVGGRATTGRRPAEDQDAVTDE